MSIYTFGKLILSQPYIVYLPLYQSLCPVIWFNFKWWNNNSGCCRVYSKGRAQYKSTVLEEAILPVYCLIKNYMCSSYLSLLYPTYTYINRYRFIARSNTAGVDAMLDDRPVCGVDCKYESNYPSVFYILFSVFFRVYTITPV